jgi:hypothetical protein
MMTRPAQNLGRTFRLLLVCAIALARRDAFARPHPDRKNVVHPPYQVDRKVPRPEIFAEGTISTVDDEMGSAFSPDGTEFYFSKFVPYTTAPRLGANVCLALSCWAVEHA